MAKRFGCLGCLVQPLLACVLGGVALYAVVALTDPWAFHIGGRSTPFLTWRGSGKLLTKSGEYPLYLYFYPSSHSSQLHREGLRPVGGLQGYGWICISPGMAQPLELSGTIFGGWRSTENSLVTFRLLEAKKVFSNTVDRGFFDLAGRFRGPELVMDDHGDVGHPFRSGMRIEHASVTLDWGSYSDFKAVCANARNLTAHR